MHGRVEGGGAEKDPIKRGLWTVRSDAPKAGRGYGGYEGQREVEEKSQGICESRRPCGLPDTLMITLTEPRLKALYTLTHSIVQLYQIIRFLRKDSHLKETTTYPFHV